MKGKKITGAAILLFAGLALALYFLKKDPLREVHALWEETMSRTEGAYVLLRYMKKRQAPILFLLKQLHPVPEPPFIRTVPYLCDSRG